MNKNYILQGGELKAYTEQDLMEISGWVSTGGIDLANEIVEPTAVTKHLDTYRKAGRLWYNHDPNQVLGRVHEISMESKGLHANRIKLADTPFNREYIWPLIKEGALSEFSIQFRSLKGQLDRKTGIYHHQEIFLIECSVVSVACNPAAVIDGFKSLIPSEEWYGASVPELAKLYNAGQLKLPSEQRSVFAVDGFKGATPDEEMMSIEAGEPLTPDFADIVVIDMSPEQKSAYNPHAEAIDLPKEQQANYKAICECIYLAQSDTRKSFMFRVGVPTENGGYKYDWDSVALSMCSILGAKGPAHFAPDQKQMAVKKLVEIYRILRKGLPTWNGIALDQVADEYLGQVSFKEVEFAEGERDILEKNIFMSNLKGLVNFLRSKEKSGDDVTEFLKYAYGQVGFSISVSPYDDADWTLITNLLAAWQKYRDSEDEMHSLSFTDFLKQYAEEVNEEEEAPEEVKEKETPEEVKEETPEPVKGYDLTEALKTFLTTN